MLRRLLERLGQTKNRLVTEHLPREVKRGRHATMKTAREADDRMPCAIGQQLPAADEEVQSRHRRVDLFHHAGAEPVGLNELHRRCDVRGANFDRARGRTVRGTADRRQFGRREP